MSISVSLWYTYSMENEKLSIRSITLITAEKFVREHGGGNLVFNLYDDHGNIHDVLITEPFVDKTLIEIFGWCDIDQSNLYRSYRNAMADIDVYRVGPIGSDL